MKSEKIDIFWVLVCGVIIGHLIVIAITIKSIDSKLPAPTTQVQR